ncbi:TonB-dependent receptor, partial [Pseudomonas typographi]
SPTPRSLRRAANLALLCSVNLGLAAIPANAMAEDAPATDEARLPDVTVTAERRETSLQKTPVAVGVIGGAELDKKNAKGLHDLAAGTVAGLDVPGNTAPSMGYRSIRGIGTGVPGQNSAVALYLDDVYIPRIINSGVFGLPDIERIEVLRGPQGTLYGQNSSAGAIKVISATPTDEYHASLSVGAGNHGARESKGFITGALAPGVLYGSFAYTRRENDGTVRNKTLNKDVNRIDTDQARAKLRLVFNEATEAVLSLDALKDTSDNYAPTRVNVPGWQKRVTYENKPLDVKNEGGGISLKVSSQLNDQLQFKSITAWRRFKTDPDVWSYDGIADRKYGWQFNLEQHQASQEFQLNGDYGALTYTTGVIGFVENVKVNRPNWTNNVYNGITSKTDVQTLGIYGQGHYKLTDKLGFTAGVRFSKQQDDYDWTSYRSNAALANLGTTGRLDDLSQDTQSWTPKLGLDYQLTDNLFSYFSYAKGEKAGGYNVVAGSAAVAGVPVDPEKVTSYELGLKNTALEGRLQTNVAVFYNDFDDYQASISNPVVNGQVINGAVFVNAAKAVLYGAEFEVSARPTRTLQLRLNATYIKSEFKDFLNPTGNANSDYSGRPVPGPSWLAGAGFDYQPDIPALPGSIAFFGDVSYRGKEHQLNDYPEPLPARILVNLGALYNLPGDHWSVSVNVQNVLNKTYPLSRTYVSAFDILSQTYNDPRTLLVSVKRDFF